ncbi:copper chaperone PCu(A)C [Caldovatus aquaticus]|uniref:Copper chaperone PCu(A)C n=1 Tax=Caldovatus aquaticus TaxID=2865671 RepID=A0ABS7F253_9PROT|nr:copper chaperone PCu(A)C [Caldovatus aquaticus]MBW8269654.1 copper chaperone PCu(A)C [Caldovatus aquaticus]
MRRRLVLSLAAALPTWGRAPRAQTAPPIEVSAAWSRAAPQGGTGAGFLVLRNRGATPDRIVAASSPLARAVELHTHIREGDVLRMRPVPAIELPPGAEVRLAPGGLHLMLIGLQRPLREGDRVPVTLTLERGGTLTVELEVLAAGARGPAASAPGGGHGAPGGHGGVRPH